jgi:hypothetical protein
MIYSAVTRDLFTENLRVVHDKRNGRGHTRKSDSGPRAILVQRAHGLAKPRPPSTHRARMRLRAKHTAQPTAVAKRYRRCHRRLPFQRSIRLTRGVPVKHFRRNPARSLVPATLAKHATLSAFTGGNQKRAIHNVQEQTSRKILQLFAQRIQAPIRQRVLWGRAVPTLYLYGSCAQGARPQNLATRKLTECHCSDAPTI